MAKGRLIHKVFYSHVETGELPIEARYLYIGLMVHADDAGRIKANPKYLKAIIYPFDENIKSDNIRKWRDLICERGLGKLYSVAGQEYLCHPNWEKWQPLRKDRVQESECPAPPRQKTDILGGTPTKCQPDGNHASTDGCPNLTKPNLKTTLSSSADAADVPLPVSGKPLPDQQAPKNTYPRDFDTFWQAYPRKVGKAAALKRWKTHNPPLTEVLNALEVQRGCAQWQDISLIPHPETWINKRRWEDDPTAYAPAKPVTDNHAYCEADSLQGGN